MVARGLNGAYLAFTETTLAALQIKLLQQADRNFIFVGYDWCDIPIV